MKMFLQIKIQEILVYGAYRVCIFNEYVRPFDSQNVVLEPKLDAIRTLVPSAIRSYK